MWYLYAIWASIVWGISYSLIPNLLKSLNIWGFLMLDGLARSILFWLIFFFSWKKIMNVDVSQIWMKNLLFWIIIIFSFWLWAGLITLWIQKLNPTIASLIEISYPIFVILFSYLFFANSNLNIPTIIWWLLIFAWVWTIIFFNK